MKTLVILSSAKCVWDDFDKVTPMLGSYDTLAVNHMIMHYPDGLTYGVSWHFDYIQDLIAVRIFRNRKNRPITYGPKQAKDVDHTFRFDRASVTTSGMYAVHVGLHLGYDKIIVCGVPFDSSGHFCDRDAQTRFDTIPSYELEWSDTVKRSGNRVRFVSGNLTKCFGELTAEWIKS
jgi:hypothetical protein